MPSRIFHPKVVRNYFEAYPDYLARKRELDAQINAASVRFEKRLNRARILNRARDCRWRLKSAVENITKLGAHMEDISAVMEAIKILKLIRK